MEKVEANTVERWGVQQSEVVITYRFSQPNEPAALVMPRSHKLRNRNQAPEELNTLGDHLLRRRLMLKLFSNGKLQNKSAWTRPASRTGRSSRTKARL